MKHGELREVYMFVDRGRYALLENFLFLFVFCENFMFFEEINGLIICLNKKQTNINRKLQIF